MVLNFAQPAQHSVFRKGFVMRRVHNLGSRQRGTSLIEMMIAMLVLAVGLLGSMAVVSVSIGSNNRSKRDSTSAALAEMVAGQLSAIPAGSNASITVTDCAGNNLSINTTGSSTGTGANLTTSGNIDFTQKFSSVTSGYAIQYTMCGVTSGTQALYDVRWNIKTLPSNKGNFVVVGAQVLNSTTASKNDPRLFAPAVNVRTVVGTDGN